MTVVIGHSAATRTRVLTAPSSRSLKFVPFMLVLLDVAVVAAVSGLASFFDNGMPMFDAQAADDLGSRTTGPLVTLGWVVVIALGGGYRKQVLGGGSDEYKRVLNATLAYTGLLALILFVTQADVSRAFFLLLFAFGLPGLLLARWGARNLLHRARIAGHLGLPVLIAGSPEHVDDIHGVLDRTRWLGYRVVGAVTPPGEAGHTVGGVPVIGTTDDVTTAALQSNAQLILFAGGSSHSAQDLQEKVWQLEERGIGVVVAQSATGIIMSDRASFRPVGGLPLMHLGAPAWAQATRVGKRTFDFLGALALLAAFSPLFLFIALRIKLHDGGPVFFQQSRVGRQGVPFRCAKFRTMVPNAEDLLAALHAQTNYDGGLFKMADDPRITKPGRWLRRFSLDELPQLWNVVRGDMSLVGPRPPLPHEVARYDVAARRRLHVRPGMTGLWQVSGRSDLSWEHAIRLDLYYVDHWSMLQDLHILWRTLGVVILGRGAY
ncbi:sugar transferase [Nocardioides bizhenqiangii]|uniref:Sugar transferase n=1 Tax=Nocardioides bizhenqiangii TaxID=3095076 RepID=A0ABZ0ZNX1_9ACTN|nr:sugar transferase [Nocardioides sp. HM61]WQQ25908.1 sugar transferase [Nocardioides sp. HM61]